MPWSSVRLKRSSSEPDRAEDGLPALDQLGIGAAHELDGPLGEALQERRLHAGRTAEAGRAADDAPQHVAAALVARQHAVRDEERHGAGVLRHHAQGDVHLRCRRRYFAGELLAQLDQRLNRSVTKTEVTPCLRAAMRSRPMPVSMFCLGSGVSCPSSSML